MTKFSQINKKFKIILAFSLFGVLSENAFAAGIDNLIENDNANLLKHQTILAAKFICSSQI